METIYDFVSYHILCNMILFIFLVLSLISFLLLILSLVSHTKQVKLQGIYSRDSSTEAHVKAMKTMISLIVLFIMYYFSNFI
jgi:taste receptor type 2